MTSRNNFGKKILAEIPQDSVDEHRQFFSLGCLFFN